MSYLGSPESQEFMYYCLSPKAKARADDQALKVLHGLLLLKPCKNLGCGNSSRYLVT